MIKLRLYGNKCNDYPTVKVQLNKATIFSGIVVDNVYVDLPCFLQDNDTITISGIDKKHGENGVWDTIVGSDGTIIEYKYLKINSIMLFDIDMGTDWIKSINNGSDSFYDDGSFSFTVKYPFYDWIIEEKFIKQEKEVQANLASSYSGHGRYSYEPIKVKIDAIKKLLDD